MGSFLSSQSQLPPACSSAAAAAATASPQWMLLAPYGGGRGEACNITGDSETIATAATSNGHRISFSLRRDPFSSLSRICLCFLPGTASWPWASSTVIAAHGGYVLLQITTNSYLTTYTYDCFVYKIETANPKRKPSLYLLPGFVDVCATGLLCCGEAEFVVAELTIVGSKDDAAWPWRRRQGVGPVAFELRLFRHGKWSVKRPWIIHGHGIGMYRKQLRAQWETIAVVLLGNGMLCWVDQYSGVIFSDVLHEGGNKLRYVPYPAEAVLYQRFVCTNVRGALKLVSISPHLCSHCGCSEHVTNNDIWTLKTDDMAWVFETETNIADSIDLWMILVRPGYARTHLVYPVATMNGGGHIVASMNGAGDVASHESAVPMEEEGAHIRLSASSHSAMASLHDGLQGGNGEISASTSDHKQGGNGPATVGRWPKRRRRANSMVTGPEWIAY